MRFSKILIVWGVVDILCLSYIAIRDLLNNQVPFWHDVKTSLSFAEVWAGGEGLEGSLSVAYVFVLISVLGLISIFVSAFLLLYKPRLGVYVSLVQFPFRLLTVISASLFPLAIIVPGGKMVYMLLFLVATETLRVASLVFWLRSYSATCLKR